MKNGKSRMDTPHLAMLEWPSFTICLYNILFIMRSISLPVLNFVIQRRFGTLVPKFCPLGFTLLVLLLVMLLNPLLLSAAWVLAYSLAISRLQPMATKAEILLLMMCSGKRVPSIKSPRPRAAGRESRDGHLSDAGLGAGIGPGVLYPNRIRRYDEGCRSYPSSRNAIILRFIKPSGSCDPI